MIPETPAAQAINQVSETSLEKNVTPATKTPSKEQEVNTGLTPEAQPLVGMDEDPFEYVNELGDREPLQVATSAPLRKILQNYAKQTRTVVLDQTPESIERTKTRLTELGIPTDPKAPLPKYAININLENLAGPDDINRLILNVAQAIPDVIQTQRRGKQKWTMTKAKAYQQLEEGEGFLLDREIGEAMNAEQITAARYILVDSRDKVTELALKVKNGDDSSETLIAFRQALARHSAVQAQLHGAAAEAGRALNAFRIVAEEQNLRNRELEDILRVQGGPEEIKGMVDAYLNLGDNPTSQNAFARESTRPGFPQMVKEYWYNFVLSGWKTHLANISGNTMNMGLAPIERGVAAQWGKMFGFMGGKPGVKSGEAAALWSGYSQSMGDAWRLFNFSFRHNANIGEQTNYSMPLSLKDIYTTRTQDIGQAATGSANNKMDMNQAAITSENVKGLMPNWANPDNYEDAGMLTRFSNFLFRSVDIGGGVLRTPSRLLGAEDQFFKTLAYRAELKAQAVREASNLGLEGEDLTAYVDEFMMNPDNNARMSSMEFADELTFTEQLENPISKGFQGVGNSDWGFLIAPFVRVTSNILDSSTMRVLAPLRPKWWREAFSDDPVKRDLALAKASTGAAIWASAYATTARNYMCQDPDDICVTGSKPQDPRLNSVWLKNGMQEYSVRLDGEWYQYSRMDPAGQMLGMAADTVHMLGMMGEQDASAFGTALVAAIGNNVVNKNYMRSIAESMEVFTSFDVEMWKRWLQNKGSSFVLPNILAQVAYEQDNNLKEAREFGDRIASKNPFIQGEVAYKRDIAGEKIPVEYLFSTHIKTKDAKPDPVADELWRLQFPFSKPSKNMNGVELDPFQYDRYQALAGHGLKMPSNSLYFGPMVKTPEGQFEQVEVDLSGKGMWEALGALINARGYKYATDDIDPPGQKAAMIKEIQMKYRQASQARLLSEYPELKSQVIGTIYDRNRAQGMEKSEANLMTGAEANALETQIQLIGDYEVRTNDDIH